MKFTPGSWIFFLSSVIIILIITPLFQKGCFIDGMLYKTVSYNYAEGLGSFWKMKFTDTSMRFFCEQPPLYFYFLGNFYKLFGVHYLTDRVFTILLFISLLGILYLITKQLFKIATPYFLLSCFFLLAIPVFCWSYVNQGIEPLLCVFTGLGILFFIKFLRTSKKLFMVLFSLTCYALFLTKGFQSCFIAVLPLTYFLVAKFKKPFLSFSFFFTAVFFGLLLGTLLLYPPAKMWFDCYYNARLVLTLDNVGNTTDNHFEIIGRFFSELLLILICVVVLISYLGVKKGYPLKFIVENFISNKLAFALLVSSFAGSFPYAISLVQRGFYLIPSFICFVLAFVYGLKRYWIFFFVVLQRVEKYRPFYFFTRILTLACIFYFYFNYGSYKRNKDLLSDVDKVLPFFKAGETVLIEPELWNDFSMHSYLYMAKKVSLSVEKKDCGFLIRPKLATDTVNYRKIALDTKEIELYALPGLVKHR